MRFPWERGLVLLQWQQPESVRAAAMPAMPQLLL
ncbi:hypothetical protein ACAN107058_02810 [Paracidovorax anthurii]|uniref:Uncharacterized protein n=1 Tax=Paracidovorax anthurii TaxID=78229 RepID=A0A328ZUI3_9BURK|nr:hypothetical protein AX018_1003149 [Paracidovorax anthurii]